jgi:hypothetical protein
MRARYWLAATISAILISTAAIAGLNMSIDVYGLYRSTRGRQLYVLGDERVAKYLLSMRYVPQNFNALLSGASISANWRVTAIDRLRVYNESLNGATIIEEKALIEASLQRPGISVVLLLVHPALTYSNEFRTIDMTPSLRQSALGSLTLWAAYKDMINIRLGRLPQWFDYAGTETYLDGHHEMNPHMKAMWEAPEFDIDPAAWRAYFDLVGYLRAHGVKVVFIVPPTSEQLLSTKRPALSRYLERVHSEVGTGDLWIDFMSPEQEALRRTPANFSDGVHLTSSGAKQVVSVINTTLNQWLDQRRLVIREQ